MRNVLKHPLVFNAICYGGLYGGADISQQLITDKVSQKSTSVDLSSAGRFFAFGTGFIGPVYYFLYGWMDRVFPGRAAKTVFKKLAFDQIVNSPPMLLAFFTGVGLMEKKSLTTIKAELKQKYISTYLTGCAFWPPAQALNFALIPPQFRVIYVGCAAYVWTVFLSYMKHQSLQANS